MKKPFSLLILTIIMALLAGCSNNGPNIQLELESFEFGDVVNGNIVSKDVMIYNTGTIPLNIEQVTTSCGCTTAEVSQGQIAPDGSAILHIEFDSGAHGPEMTGTLTRQVFVATDDPDQPDLIVQFTVNVVK